MRRKVTRVYNLPNATYMIEPQTPRGPWTISKKHGETYKPIRGKHTFDRFGLAQDRLNKICKITG